MPGAESLPQRENSPRTMVLVLAALYLAGATTGALTLILPHPVAADDPLLWSNVALAFLAAVVLAAGAGRMPAWMVQVALGLGTLVITRAIYYGGDPGSFYAYWYVWVGLYAFFFFGRAWGMAHLALVGVAYGWVLTQIPQSSPIARWFMTVGTIAIAGILIDVLTQRVRRRAADADGRARILAAVSSIAHDLSGRTTAEAAAPAVCESVVELSGAKAVVLWQPSSDGSGLVAIASTAPEIAGGHLAFVSRPSGIASAFTGGEPVFVPEVEVGTEPDPTRLGARSALFQPVSREGTAIAVLAVYWEQQLERLPEELGRAIGLMAVEAAIAIERAETLDRLERVARTDDLTGLANRRAWDEHLRREVSRARRDGTSLAIAILDLDHFKLYNDRHGHLAGDRLLKQIGARWQALIRDTDILARYGGEEFALALPGASADEAMPLLERLREATPRGERISAGVAEWNGEEDEAALTERADRALYGAKRGGRDRVTTA